MAEQRIEPAFVEFIPEALEVGKIYISTRFRTASHLCACGCGLKVVTPIKPTKWRFTYDGETVSLSPSIGRWQLPCKSHYCIRTNEIVWASAFSDEEMRTVQRRDARDTHTYYERRASPNSDVGTISASPVAGRSRTNGTEDRIWIRIGRWLHLR